MSNATLVNTVQTELLAFTAIASAAQQISSIFTPAGKIVGKFLIDFGLDSATTPVGTEIIIQESQKASGDDTWRMIWSAVTGTVAPSAIVMDAEEAATSTVIECGATVPALNDSVFFKNATIANSEWAKVRARVITGGSESFTIQDGLTNTQAAITLYNKAEQYVVAIPLAAGVRYRVVFNNNYAASSASCVGRVALITLDSVATA